MTQTPTNPELDELNLRIGMLRQWLNEDRIKDASKFVTNEDIHHWLDSAIQKEALKARDETAKAYGGCTKCYGKGYATIIEYTSGWDTDTDIGSSGGHFKHKKPLARYCTCDRGKQLADLEKQLGSK